jgi:hypothetical protein
VPPVTAVKPHVVTLSLADGVFQAPDTIEAGLTTFRFANNDDEIHYAHAIRMDSGGTASQLVEAYGEAVRTAGPRPTWITRAGGPGGTWPGDTSAVTHFIGPARYVWVCPIDNPDMTPHLAHGEVREFVVREAAPDAPEQQAPEPTHTIRLVNYAFAFDTPLTAGHNTIRVVNEGPDPHDLVLVKLEPGKTSDDILAWLQAPEGPPPFGAGGGVAVLARGMEAFFDADLTPGDYALLCMATAQDGRTHIENGMVHQVSVR